MNFKNLYKWREVIVKQQVKLLQDKGRGPPCNQMIKTKQQQLEQQQPEPQPKQPVQSTGESK